MAIYERSFAGPLLHLFDFDRFPPSVERLPAALTINGITVMPTFRYKGGDANAVNWPAWGYGETLTLQAGTAPTLNNGSPLLGQMDDSVKFNGGGYYQASNNSFADVTTEDLIIELVLRPTNTDLESMVGKGLAYGAGHNAWGVWTYSNSLYVDLQFDGSQDKNTAVATMTNAWIHVIFFFDRSNLGVGYCNGTVGSAVDITAISSLTSAAPLTLGRGQVSPITFNGPIAYAAMWKQASWLDTHLQATVAKTRFAQLTGMYPQQARGTALPTTMARTTAGYLDKIEADGTTKLYYVGANWPRSCSRKDSGDVTRKGYLSETSAQNICLQSETLETTWIRTALTSITSNETVAPNGLTVADGPIPDATTTVHHLGQVIVLSAITYTLSIFAKNNDATKVFLGLSNDTIGTSVTGTAWFNLATGVVASAGSLVTAAIVNNGNGWYRCSISFTGAVGNNAFRLYLAPTASAAAWSGDAVTVSSWLFGAQIELGNYPSSYIPTTTVAVTKTADSLRYKMDDGNLNAARGSLECNVLCPNVVPTAQREYWILSEGVGNEQISMCGLSGGFDKAYARVYTGGVAQSQVTSTTSIWNNGWNKLRGIWGSNDARLLVNSVLEGTPDTSVIVPTGLTQLDVGAYVSSGYELNGLLANLKILGLNTTHRG